MEKNACEPKLLHKKVKCVGNIVITRKEGDVHDRVEEGAGPVAALLHAPPARQVVDEVSGEAAVLNVRGVAQGADLRQHDRKGPDITFDGEHGLCQAFQRRPFVRGRVAGLVSRAIKEKERMHQITATLVRSCCMVRTHQRQK